MYLQCLRFEILIVKTIKMKNRIFRPAAAMFLAFALFAFTPKSSNYRSFKKRTESKVKESFRLTSPSSYYIIVSKKNYELNVYDEEGWYATYPIVFGSKDLGDKMREGDRKTPTGSFKVLMKKTNKRWGIELLLDYPNAESWRKFNERKAKGLIPKNAKIGDGIAIHSTRKEEEWTVDNFYNWTDGCISVKYSEMGDLYSYIPAGTPVTIQP
jgi:murein L,D-transpeptidase YafK